MDQIQFRSMRVFDTTLPGVPSDRSFGNSCQGHEALHFGGVLAVSRMRRQFIMELGQKVKAS